MKILFNKMEECTKALWQARKKVSHSPYNEKRNISTTGCSSVLKGSCLLCFVLIIALRLWKFCYFCPTELRVLIRAATWTSEIGGLFSMSLTERWWLKDQRSCSLPKFKKSKTSLKLNLFMKLKCIGHLGNTDRKAAGESKNTCTMQFEDMTTAI